MTVTSAAAKAAADPHIVVARVRVFAAGLSQFDSLAVDYDPLGAHLLGIGHAIHFFCTNCASTACSSNSNGSRPWLTMKSWKAS